MSGQSLEVFANGHMSGGSVSGGLPGEMQGTTSTTPSMGIVLGLRKFRSAFRTGKNQFSHGLSTTNYSGDSCKSNSVVKNKPISDAKLHSEITDVSVQVQSIQQQLTAMVENDLVTDEKLIRLMQDNAVLQERLHSMEELLQQTEERWQEKDGEEKHRAKDIVGRLEREKALELESWTLKHQMLEQEMGKCRREREKLAEEAEKMRLDIRESADDVQIRLRQLEEERADLSRELQKQKEEAQAEICRHAQLLADLTRDNEEFRSLLQSRPWERSIAEKATDLAEELSRLREEHRHVQEVNEQLHAELLQAHGRSQRTTILFEKELLIYNQAVEADREAALSRFRESGVGGQWLLGRHRQIQTPQRPFRLSNDFLSRLFAVFVLFVVLGLSLVVAMESDRSVSLMPAIGQLIQASLRVHYDGTPPPF